MDIYKKRTTQLLDFLMVHGMSDGAHHKMWVIDQAVRILTGCEYSQAMVACIGESEEYRQLIASYCAGDGGEDEYEWDTGIAP